MLPHQSRPTRSTSISTYLIHKLGNIIHFSIDQQPQIIPCVMCFQGLEGVWVRCFGWCWCVCHLFDISVCKWWSRLNVVCTDRTRLSISEWWLNLTRGSQSVIFSLVGQISLRSHRPSKWMISHASDNNGCAGNRQGARKTVVQKCAHIIHARLIRQTYHYAQNPSNYQPPT